MNESGEISLLGRTIPFAAQPWNKVAQLGPTIGLAMRGKSGVAGMGAGAYDFLCELAPEVGAQIPRWEWMGFASQADMDASTAPVGPGVGPSLPAIYTAIQTALQVNGADTLESIAKGMMPGLAGLGKLVSSLVDDEAMAHLRAVVSAKVQEAVMTIYSSTSPSPNGAPASTSGSASSPPSGDTPADGRSPASVELSPAAT